MPVSGIATDVWADEYALTGDLNQMTATITQNTPDVTPFRTNDTVLVAGPQSATLSITGMLEAGAGSAESELWDALDTPVQRVATVAFGDGIGRSAVLFNPHTLGLQNRATTTDAVRITGNMAGDSVVAGGPVLHELEEETGTGNYTSVDSSASSAFGYVAHVHVTAFTGTNCVIRIQDSVNDSTWTDLATFTTVTGVGAERVTGSGTVDRYLRAQIVSGTFTSITFAVAIARRYR